MTRNSAIELTVQEPTISDEHISLYNSYHADMHHRRQWPHRVTTHDQYEESFLEGHFSFSREFQYRDQGRLVGLGLVDVTAAAMSSIYFFHDPEYREAGLGTYSIQKEIEFGRTQGRASLYMGYYIRDCASMNYKNRFEPNQLLQSYAPDDEDPAWGSP